MNANVEQEPRVDLVFHGQVLAGFDPAQVKRAIGDFFKLDDPRRDRMFSGAPHVIKRGLTPADASRYVALFEKLGGRLHSQGSAVPVPVRTPEPAAGPAPQLPPSTPPAAPAARAPLALAPVEAAAVRPAEAKAAPEPAERSRPASMAGEPLVVMDEPPSVFGVGLSGRLARRPYGAAALFGWAAIRWSLLVLAHHPHRGVVALSGLALLAAALWTFRLTILRLHDIGLSGWWVLVGAVPIVGTLAGILLSLVPGSSNDNRFGAVPDPGNPALRLVVGVAVLCIGAGFRHGLLLGDGGSGAGLGAQAVQPASQAEGPAAAPTDEELSALLKTAQARHDFREAYWPAKGHKAFASSDGGAWGWSADAATAASAQEQALAQCEKARDAYSGECRPLHVDGDWAD